MDVLNIEGTDETPTVVLDKGAGKFEFSGKSLPEDPMEFFTPILSWLDAYNADANPETVAVFKMSYFNTASSKLILDIMMKFEELQEAGGSEVTLEWHFDEEDEDMEEAGEEYEDIVEVTFKQVPF